MYSYDGVDVGDVNDVMYSYDGVDVGDVNDSHRISRSYSYRFLKRRSWCPRNTAL